jgi:hypothetical protein
VISFWYFAQGKFFSQMCFFLGWDDVPATGNYFVRKSCSKEKSNSGPRDFPQVIFQSYTTPGNLDSRISVLSDLILSNTILNRAILGTKWSSWQQSSLKTRKNSLKTKNLPAVKSRSRSHYHCRWPAFVRRYLQISQELRSRKDGRDTWTWGEHLFHRWGTLERLAPES